MGRGQLGIKKQKTFKRKQKLGPIVNTKFLHQTWLVYFLGQPLLAIFVWWVLGGWWRGPRRRRLPPPREATSGIQGRVRLILGGYCQLKPDLAPATRGTRILIPNKFNRLCLGELVLQRRIFAKLTMPSWDISNLNRIDP